MWYHERASVHFTIARSLRLKPGTSHDLCQSSPALAPLDDFTHGGCTGVRLREARNPGPAIRERSSSQRSASVSTKRGTQYWAVRTLLCVEFTICRCQILWQCRPLLQPQHQHRCQTLPDLKRAATSATRIPSLCSTRSRSFSLQKRIGPRPHAAHGSEARGTTTHPRKRCTATPS